MFGIVQNIGVGPRKFLEVRRIFARISPNLPESCCTTFANKFSPTKITNTFFCATSKKNVFICFFENRWASVFEVTQRWAPFLPGFSGISLRFSGILSKYSGISPRFLTDQIFWGFACTPCTPASYTTGPEQKQKFTIYKAD